MKIGILLFNDVEELDFVGPWEMFTMWKAVGATDVEVFTVAQSKATPIRCAKGLSVNAHYDFTDCPAMEVLLVPGGQGTRAEVNNTELVAFIRKRSQACEAILSVCTGAFVLHAAGLLSEKRATTHWGSLERLRALGDVQVVEERFVQDGNLWSSAGVSAGIDMALAFIAHTAGETMAGRVQFASEYYPSGVRYGGFNTHEKAPAYIRPRS